MTTFKRKQGDVRDTLTVLCRGTKDLATATAVEARVQYGTDAGVTLPGSVLDPVARLVTIQLGNAGGWLTTAKLGAWRMVTRITFGDGTRLTWPEDGFDELLIGPQPG
jgi:hypothetical protein